MLVSLSSAVVLAGTAAAQDPVQAAEIAGFDGYFIEDGADENFGEFDDLALRADQTGTDWYFVSLFEPAETGNSFFANEVFQYVEDPGMVIVVSPTADGSEYDVGIAGESYSETDIDAALDEAAQTLNPGVGDAYDRFNAVFVALSAKRLAESGQSDGGSDASGDSNGDSDDSGGSALPLVAGVLGVGGVVGGGIWWSRRKQEQEADARDAADVAAARTEIKAQLDVVANKILDQGASIEMSQDDRAILYYREASATFSDVDDELPRAESLLELAELNDDIDHARWKMEAALALAEGRPVPPEPEPDKPSACFFDPTHRPGTELCTVNTAAGGKEVNVCNECAEKLRKGERPDPRMIQVHGRSVPAARAPRSHGGLGMGGLDIFDIVLGGGMGRSNRRRGGFGGGFGGSGGFGGGFGSSSGGMFDWGVPGRSTSRSRRATVPQTRTRRAGGVFGPDRVPRSNPKRQRPASRSAQRRSSGSTSRRTSTGRSTPKRSGAKRRSSSSARGRRRM